jgi:hypothetical protein
MDYSKYAALKLAGKPIPLVKVGPATVASFTPQYDSLTGALLTPVTEQFNLVGLDESIAAQQAQLAAVQEFRADIAATLAV